MLGKSKYPELGGRAVGHSFGGRGFRSRAGPQTCWAQGEDPFGARLQLGTDMTKLRLSEQEWRLGARTSPSSHRVGP